jgi:[acyl-carrier-protein] S-malonyltransferase
VVNNVTGNYVADPDEIRQTLMVQVMKPVLWEQSMRKMLADGIDTFIEVGPGKVLSGLVKRIDRQAKSYQVHDPASLEEVVNILQGAHA